MSSVQSTASQSFRVVEQTNIAPDNNLQILPPNESGELTAFEFTTTSLSSPAENLAVRNGTNIQQTQFDLAQVESPNTAFDTVFRQVSRNEQRLIDRRIGEILTSDNPVRDLANALGTNSAEYRAAFISRFLQTKPDYATLILSGSQSPDGDSTTKSAIAGAFSEAYQAANREGYGQQFVDNVINGLRASQPGFFQQHAPLLGRLVANTGNDGLIRTFSTRALDFANTVGDSPFGEIISQGLSVAAFQSAASKPEILKDLLSSPKLTDRVFNGLMNEASFTGSLPSTLGQVLNTAANNNFGTDFFMRVADKLTGGEKREARAAAVYFLNRHSGEVAQRTANSRENQFAINNLLLKTADIRPREAVAGAGGLPIPSAFDDVSEAVNRFNEVNQPGTVWTMRLNVGNALGHTQINLYANGEYFGTLQGDLLGSALYTSPPNGGGRQGAVIPLSADQVRAGIQEVYQHGTPWGTWLCHDVTAAAFRAMGFNSEDVYRSTPTGEGFNYIAGHLISKLAVPATGIGLGLHELWNGYVDFVNAVGSLFPDDNAHY